MIYNNSKFNSTWDVKKLDELGVFSRGVSRHRPRNDERLFENGKYPFIQTGDIKHATLFVDKHTQEYGEFGLSQSKLWNAGTLCITIAANIAETGILAYPMCFPDSIVGFNANADVSSELFMHYIFEYVRHAIQNAAIGSIQDNINIEYLSTLNFRVPEKNYQDKICCVLASIDKKILTNNHINDDLIHLAYNVYMHLFFEKENNGILKDIIIENSKSNIQVSDAENMEGNFPFFTSGDEILEWTENMVSGRNCYINTGGNAGVAFYVGDASYSTDTWCITGKNNMADYLYLLLFSIKRELNMKFFHGTGLKHLQKPLLKERRIYIPPAKELSVFNDCIQPMLDIASANTLENRSLIKLRNWLLPMLMNGQAIIAD